MTAELVTAMCLALWCVFRSVWKVWIVEYLRYYPSRNLFEKHVVINNIFANCCCIAIAYPVEVNHCTKDYRHTVGELVPHAACQVQNQAVGMLHA